MYLPCGFVYFNCFILVKFPFKTFKLLIDGYSGSVPLMVRYGSDGGQTRPES